MKAYAILEDAATPYLETVGNATVEEIQAANAQFGGAEPDSIITRDSVGGRASITIEGMLTPKGPSAIARFFGFGGTGYNDIIEAANELKDDPTVSAVTLLMDTPGGRVDGMDQAWQALSELNKVKKVTAENHGRIASGGYYLATAASEIVAMSPLAETGSIGVVIAGLDFSEADARRGIKQIKIVSSNAPNKQPDPATASGRSVLQEQIDAIERVFIDKIVEGRGLERQQVLDNFGKGGTLIAADPDPSKPSALSVGMIDKVITQGGNAEAIAPEVDESFNTPPPIGAENKRRVDMNLDQLKAEHPQLHAEVLAAGVAIGVAQEKGRTSAHLTMAEASGDTALALSCIESGEDLTPAVSAKHMAASMNKKATTDRADESVDDVTTPAADEIEANEEALAKATADALGVEYNG